MGIHQTRDGRERPAAPATPDCRSATSACQRSDVASRASNFVGVTTHACSERNALSRAEKAVGASSHGEWPFPGLTHGVHDHRLPGGQPVVNSGLRPLRHATAASLARPQASSEGKSVRATSCSHGSGHRIFGRRALTRLLAKGYALVHIDLGCGDVDRPSSVW